MTYILKKLGFNNPTKIEQMDVAGNKVIVITKGLDICETVNEWKDQFLAYGKFTVQVDGVLFRSMQQRTLASAKSCLELFQEQGVIFEVKDE